MEDDLDQDILALVERLAKPASEPMPELTAQLEDGAVVFRDASGSIRMMMPVAAYRDMCVAEGLDVPAEVTEACR